MKSIAMKYVMTIGLACWPVAGMSHPGHGMEAGHWHATDVWGFVAMAVAVVAAIWFTRGGK